MAVYSCKPVYSCRFEAQSYKKLISYYFNALFEHAQTKGACLEKDEFRLN